MSNSVTYIVSMIATAGGLLLIVFPLFVVAAVINDISSFVKSFTQNQCYLKLGLKAFQTNVPFFYPLKTLENELFVIFRGYKIVSYFEPFPIFAKRLHHRC